MHLREQLVFDAFETWWKKCYWLCYTWLGYSKFDSVGGYPKPKHKTLLPQNILCMQSNGQSSHPFLYPIAFSFRDSMSFFPVPVS